LIYRERNRTTSGIRSTCIGYLKRRPTISRTFRGCRPLISVIFLTVPCISFPHANPRATVLVPPRRRCSGPPD
jgi:hypothetical protein